MNPLQKTAPITEEQAKIMFEQIGKAFIYHLCTPDHISEAHRAVMDAVFYFNEHAEEHQKLQASHNISSFKNVHEFLASVKKLELGEAMYYQLFDASKNEK